MGIERIPEEKFSATETVNGIQIVCYWDYDEDCYRLTFPQTATSELLGYTPLLAIPGSKQRVEKVFEYAKEKAKNISNVRDLRNLMQEYIRNL